MQKFECFKLEALPHARKPEARDLGSLIAKTLNEWQAKVRPVSSEVTINHSGNSAVVLVSYDTEPVVPVAPPAAPATPPAKPAGK